VAGVAILLVLAAPALDMRQGTSDSGNDPTSLTTRRAYDLLADGFGKGFNGPLLVAANLPDGANQASLDRISSALRSTSGVASVGRAQVSPQGKTAVFNVYPKSAPQAAATTSLVNRLRDDQLPPVAAATDSTIYVAGATAIQIDLTDVMSSKLPLFIGIVVGLSALLLLVVFRSVVIPLKAALMNLLSIGAALGVVVAIFQWGWLGGLLGVKGGPIDAFIPVFLFAIVFGLSMDYEVFLVSRIHEEWTRRRDPSRAVTHGLASTGRVITAAATIMVFVFLSFVLGSSRPVKLFGLSLASAVFLDAFVVRCLLVPAALELLGRVTWFLPGRLDRWLPHLAIDKPEPEPAASEA
jgi:RND superfamily putative drug exporter